MFDAYTLSAPRTASVSTVTIAFSFGSSNTASITRSQSFIDTGSVVASIFDSKASAFSGVERFLEIALSKIALEYAFPLSAPSCETSLRTTSIPAFAETYAIPAPIIPAPKIPNFLISYLGSVFGRAIPFFAFCNSMNPVRIMFFASLEANSLMK